MAHIFDFKIYNNFLKRSLSSGEFPYQTPASLLFVDRNLVVRFGITAEALPQIHQSIIEDLSKDNQHISHDHFDQISRYKFS